MKANITPNPAFIASPNTNLKYRIPRIKRQRINKMYILPLLENYCNKCSIENCLLIIV